MLEANEGLENIFENSVKEAEKRSSGWKKRSWGTAGERSGWKKRREKKRRGQGG